MKIKVEAMNDTWSWGKSRVDRQVTLKLGWN